MRIHLNLVFAISASLLIGCAEPERTEVKTNLSETDDKSCPDDGPRFEISGLCMGRITNFMDKPETDVSFYEQMTDESCRWEVMETQFATDVLIYQGVACGQNKATLAFSSGAQAAHLHLATSPFGPDMGEPDHPLITIFSSDPENPTANLLFRTREAMEDKQAALVCEAFSTQENYGYPSDSYVVDVADALKPPLEDGPYALCGPYGFNGDERTFWRVFAGFSWFFAMGQEPVGIAEGSLMLFTKKSEGDWVKMD